MRLHLETGMRTARRAGLAALLLAASAVGAEQARTYFERTDSNEDGVVSREEYRHRMIEVFFSADGNRDGSLALEEVVDSNPELFHEADADGDGRVGLREFLEFRALGFERADANNDGVLSWEEMP